VKILFALLQSKKIATKSPPERPKTEINNRTQVNIKNELIHKARGLIYSNKKCKIIVNPMPGIMKKGCYVNEIDLYLQADKINFNTKFITAKSR